MYSSKRRMKLFRHPAFSGLATFDTLTVSGSATIDAFITKYTTLGRVAWVARIGGTGVDVVYDIKTDSLGDVYVTGLYNNTLTFYNADGSASTTTLAGISPTNCFVAKYSSSGTVQWATRMGGSPGFGNENYGVKLVIDSARNVYVTGRFDTFPSVTFYNAPGTTATLPALQLIGGIDTFVVKYNPNGIGLWATKIGGSLDDSPASIAVSSSDDIYIIGRYASGPLSIYDAPGTSETLSTLANSGSTDIFIVKYNSSGVGVWATRISGTSPEVGYDVHVDSSNDIYVVGTYRSTNLAFYDAPGTSTTLTTIPGNTSVTNSFIIKYNSNGIGIWRARVGSTSRVTVYSITTDTVGNVYLTGNDTGIITYDAVGAGSITLAAEGSRAFIAKYNSAGTAQWIAGGLANAQAFGQAIGTDSSGNVYVTGYYYSSAPWVRNSDGTRTLDNLRTPLTSSTNAFLVKYNPLGFAQWATTVDGTISTNNTASYGISVYRPSDVMYIAGSFQASTLTVRSVGF